MINYELKMGDGIIAVGECSRGNDTVGDMWYETKIFRPSDDIEDVFKWARKVGVSGKLILTIEKEEL